MTFLMHFQLDLYPRYTSYISEHAGGFGNGMWGSRTDCKN